MMMMMIVMALLMLPACVCPRVWEAANGGREISCVGNMAMNDRRSLMPYK